MKNFSFLAAVLACGLAQAQSSSNVASTIVARANGFLSALDAGQRTKVLFDAHHLALNITMVGRDGILTPSHTAAQPAKYTVEGRIVRPLGGENDKAFALINALDEGQRKQAILNYKVADLVLGPGQDGKTIQPEGIKCSAMNASKQAMLLDLVGEWAGIANEQAAAARMADLKSNLAETWFAWSGPTTN